MEQQTVPRAATSASGAPLRSDGAGRRVLVVEDEVRLARLLVETLRRAGFGAEAAHDGETGLTLASAGGFDAVVLDLMLPRLTGAAVLARLRASGSDVPVVMLTAHDDEAVELHALEIGADDYVTKPFSSRLLLARLSAVMRRSRTRTVVSHGDVRADIPARRVWLDEVEVDLSAREFDLLAHLLLREGAVVSKRELLDEVWDEPYADPNLVEACVVGLRRKLGAEQIVTVRGAGYRLRSTPS